MHEPPTPKQEAFLHRNRLHATDFYNAMGTISHFVRAQRQLPPTPRQIQLLKQHHQWREGMSRGQAYDAIKRLF